MRSQDRGSCLVSSWCTIAVDSGRLQVRKSRIAVSAANLPPERSQLREHLRIEAAGWLWKPLPAQKWRRKAWCAHHR